MKKAAPEGGLAERHGWRPKNSYWLEAADKAEIEVCVIREAVPSRLEALGRNVLLQRGHIFLRRRDHSVKRRSLAKYFAGRGFRGI
ncbi:MAG: hypothetical protein E5V61_04745 [Mesorhizobium sp.]|nr:MAG: hypothetical protein E5V61_04745 [Mesorhizobium sp.]